MNTRQIFYNMICVNGPLCFQNYYTDWSFIDIFQDELELSLSQLVVDDDEPYPYQGQPIPKVHMLIHNQFYQSSDWFQVLQNILKQHNRGNLFW